MTDSALTFLVDSFGLSDVGLVRTNNEDSFLIATPSSDFVNQNPAELNGVIAEDGTLFIVADGMGGAQAGEIASRMAVETIARNFLHAITTKELVDQQTFVSVLTATIQEA